MQLSGTQSVIFAKAKSLTIITHHVTQLSKNIQKDKKNPPNFNMNDAINDNNFLDFMKDRAINKQKIKLH